jgi:NitT/TauT family transport system permease protein
MRRILAPAVALALAIFGWWGVAAMLGLGPFLLPGPLDVAIQFTEQWPYLAEQTTVTLWQTLAGFSAAAVAAIITAVLLAASTFARDALLPLLVAVQAVPKVAIAPLLAVWLGFGFSPKITLVVLLCYFPILISTLAGLTSTPAELVEFARSLSASRWSMFTRIRIPWALPQMFTGLKVAISLAVIGAVVAQIAQPNSGLGMVIVRSTQAANTSLAFAAVTLLALIGIGLFYALTSIERLVLPWARETTG